MIQAGGCSLLPAVGGFQRGRARSRRLTPCPGVAGRRRAATEEGTRKAPEAGKMEIITAFNLSARCGPAPDLVRIMPFMWDFRFINSEHLSCPVTRRNDVGWFRNPRRADRRDRTRRVNDNITSVRPSSWF